MTTEFVSNPALDTIGPSDWMGTPLDSRGRFVNLNHPFEPELGKLLRWQTTKNPQKAEKKSDQWVPEIRPLEISEIQNQLVWLGHSSFFLRLDGWGFLIDPVFGNATVVKRKIPRLDPTPLKGKVDFLLLSHDHRDHFDTPSLKLVANQNPKAWIFSGLNMSPILKPVFPGSPITEMGWFQGAVLPGGLEVWFLPSRHWSRRGLNDTNERLWGGFIIRSSTKTVYFMGDSGYDTHFQEIGTLFPDIDVAIMGIGAYSPEWFMHSSHMNPEDSWKAFTDLGAKRFFPMHFGTFDLADEPMGEPLRRLKKVGVAEQLIGAAVGENLVL